MADIPETPAAKRRRLRWISFAELIGVLALVISAAGYWDSHRERERSESAKPVPAAPLLLTGSADAARTTLSLKPAHGDAVVQTQTLFFPTTVRADTVDTTGNARIEAGWIEDGVRKAVPSARDAHPPRLPVGIVTEFVDGGTTRRDAAIYDVGYALRERLLRGRAVELEGITLVRRLPAAGLKAAVDARWSAATATKSG
ncbi:hypothetical protein KX816_20280 [Sphingosinicellaceae bacterium]|nr:hypothetical protein KX816_20280 [Sphingosinicellaceae bacterium]